jgi:sphingosine kinase
VLVNPVGGKGKARSIVKETVLPIFEAAGCTVTMMGELDFA